ncbi:MAG: GC-type dockerin domain-anchored protein [Planctomycetota bacterium]
MKHSSLSAVATCVTLAMGAHAQTATVSLNASSSTVSAGDTVTVSLDVSYTTGSASSGLFGSPGLFGFGGNVDASGDPSVLAGVTASSPTTAAALTSGVTTSLNTGAFVRAAAGRTLSDGGFTGNPAQVLSFDVVIDASAPDGDLTLSYDGAVVLALGDTLTTYSTTPGVNQQTLNNATVTITIGNACIPDVTTTGTNPGDADYGNPDGEVSVSDLTYFVEFWLANDLSVADVTTDGSNPGDAGFGSPDSAVTVSDLTFFVEQWLAGCP